ncbi:MBOAT family O-acyltransferase [Candidatus Parabeggiatoa sp. HSG14]|uniref:MBOAT family O-acyltransferase n=1 Tax=Candidatus Parabeggiatoa sp. HSG14 TaxID=3055593 RepID=UPI0025A6B13B|nr:MBOAT family O-acyltransferase [Thiotrichales bacterium HSG14]
MLFNSYIFVLFFVVFASLYWLLRYRLQSQNLLILIGSYIFYGWWDERFLILIMISTVTDYVTALGIVKEKPTFRQGIGLSLFLLLGSAFLLSLGSFSETAWMLGLLFVFVGLGWVVHGKLMQLEEKLRKKAFVTVSVIVNLGILGFFKYFNFFIDSFQQSAAILGWQVDSVTLNIVLPVGISFYTFQTMSYTIDIYRKRFKPTRQFVEFAAFLSFFPQLVAGPIERAKHLLPQFKRLRSPSMIDIRTGLWLCVWGLYKKVVIADNLAPIVNRVFADPSVASSGELMAAVLAFTFQIYCDFSGYSDIARGLARMLGFDIMLNFNIPYIARTPSEFWRRWHISLSTWLRDYLYISLGGNRWSTLITYRNLMLTMLLGGLWHGAAWNFVLWGGYHGLILVIYRKLNVDDWLSQRTASILIQRLQDIALIFVMFILTLFGWLFFRASSLDTVWIFVTGINTLEYTPYLATIAFYLWPLLAFQALQLWFKNLEPLGNVNWFLRFNIQLFVLFSLLFLFSQGGQQFIYFNF